MTNDPAIEAADHALREMVERLGDPGPEMGAVLRDLAIDAAREALSIAGTVQVPMVEPTDTFNHAAQMPVRGWEVEGAPYYVEFLPNAGSGQIEVEHDGQRLTPITESAALSFASALVSAIGRR